MPATKPSVGTKFDNDVQQQLGTIIRRIRTHDLLSGIFLVAVVALGYLAGMMILDRLLELPAWVRQISLGTFLIISGTIVYYGIVRPFRRSVNPLYAAREVEQTIENAKNSVVNWVDLQDQPIGDSARALVAARAAKQFKEADLDKAGESRRLLWLGSALGTMIVILAALFMVFKPAVFRSLAQRTINPFSSGQIATRTRIEIIDPKAGHLTVTAGQPVNIVVIIDGKVPDVDAPDRVRLLLRHNLADENYEEVPLEAASSYREWAIRLPERLVQNGFWYRVSAGDSQTEEYQVTVRPRPILTEFEAKYDYPAYLRMKSDIVRSPHLEAHRGTVVTLTAKANRPLKDARAVLSNQPEPIVATILPDLRDTLRLQIPMNESGSYRVLFNTEDGEANTDAPVYDLRVLTDQPPSVTITKPSDDETTVPVNGLLSVDALVGDDFGIEKATLRMRLIEANQPVKTLQPKPYQAGRSFVREADGTFPTSLEYKDSVRLTELKSDMGEAVELKPDSVIEYWVEATDNCTVPTPNIGKSKVQRIRLVPAPMEPQQKEQLQQQVAKRREDEVQHQRQEKKRLDAEPRPAKPSPQQQNAEPASESTDAQPGQEKGTQKAAQSTASGTKNSTAPDGSTAPQSEANSKTEPNSKDKTSPNEAASTESKPTEQSETKTEPMNKTGEATPSGNADATQPKPMDPPAKGGDPAKQQQLKQEAQELQQKLNELENQPAQGKNQGEAQTPMGQQTPTAESKPQPQRQAPNEPNAKPQPPKAEQKPSGDKTENKPSGDPETKEGPLGGTAGQEKPGEQPMGRESSPKSASPQDAGQPKSAPQANKNSTQAGQPSQSDLEQSAKDLGSGDEAKKQQARQTLDRGIGEENRKALEQRLEERKQAAEDLASNDPARQERGRQKLSELQREAMEQDGKGNSQTRERQEGDAESLNRKRELEQAAKDLNSDDPAKQQAAREKLDKMVGQEAREKAEQLSKDLRSGDRSRQESAAEELKRMQQESEGLSKKPEPSADALTKKDQNKPKPMGGGSEKGSEKGTQPSQSDLEQSAKDLGSGDEAKKQQARQTLDRGIGEENRKALEQRLEERKQAAEDLASNDPARQERGRQKLSELQREAMEQDGKGNSQTRERQEGDAESLNRKRELEQAAKDLNSDDPAKQQAAREKLDKMVGQEAREKAEQLSKDLRSGDRSRQESAAEELKRMQQESEGLSKKPEPSADALTKKDQNNTQNGSGKPTAEQQKELEQAAKDLASNDEQKKQAAREKLDKMVGQEARQEAERRLKEREEAAKDLQSQDPKQQQRGEEKAQKLQEEQLKQAAQQQAKAQSEKAAGKPQEGGQNQKIDPRELEQAAKDLNSNDPATKQAAREKLDKMVGEDARKKSEQLMDDLKSGDPNRQQAAMEEIKNLQKQAEKLAQKNGEKPSDAPAMSPQEIEKLAQTAKDLNSPDPQKRQDAEKKLDEKLGEQARKELQDKLKAQQSATPEQAEAAKKALEELANQMPKPGQGPTDGQRDPRRDGGIGSTTDTEGKPLEANKEFTKEAAELQLEKFKKVTKTEREKLGYTEEEYQRFLSGFEKMVKEMPDVKDETPNPAKAAEAGRPTTRVDSAGKLETRQDGSKTTTNSSGVSAAPPGYGDARKRFTEGATKPAKRDEQPK